VLAEKQELYSSQKLESLLTADGRPVSVLRANTCSLKEEVFRIRYEVYCKHLAYESSQMNASGQETDVFDEWSKHYLVKDELTNQFVGTIRLVAPKCCDTQSIPIENVYPHDFFASELAPHCFEAGSYIEISRLAVVPEAAMISNSYSIEVARLLYLSALAHFHATPTLRHMHCLMEKRLARRLSFMGLPFVQCGDFFEFKGQRAPYYLGKSGVKENLRGDSKLIYDRLLAVEQSSDLMVRKVA